MCEIYKFTIPKLEGDRLCGENYNVEIKIPTGKQLSDCFSLLRKNEVEYIKQI